MTTWSQPTAEMTVRITFVVSSLGAGGAERVVATMANFWNDRGHTVTVVTLSAPTENVFFELHRGIRLDLLGLAINSPNVALALRNNVQRVRSLRRAIRSSRPAVVISFVDRSNVLTLLATRGLGVPVIVSERSNPVHTPLGRWWGLLRRLTYPWADRVVFQTECARRYFPPTIQRRGVVIPNPVTLSGAERPEVARQVLAMGRLGPEKGFDLLLEAFAQVAPIVPGWSLAIYGEGSLRPALVSLIGVLGIQNLVSLPGKTDRPSEVMRQSSIFVLSSRHEGFPNVLIEAMACGLPVISFDCANGPAEILAAGRDGILVPPEDVGALADAMRTLMLDQRERSRLGARAAIGVQRFSAASVMQQWEEAVNEVVGSALFEPSNSSASDVPSA